MYYVISTILDYDTLGTIGIQNHTTYTNKFLPEKFHEL